MGSQLCCEGWNWNAELIDYVLIIYSKDLPDNAEVSRVVETLVNTPGFGTRCMAGNPIPWVSLLILCNDFKNTMILKTYLLSTLIHAKNKLCKIKTSCNQQIFTSKRFLKFKKPNYHPDQNKLNNKWSSINSNMSQSNCWV